MFEYFLQYAKKANGIEKQGQKLFRRTLVKVLKSDLL